MSKNSRVHSKGKKLRSFDKLIQDMTLKPQTFYECRSKLKRVKELENYDFETLYESLENLRVLGIPLVELKNNYIALETTFTPIERQRFCIVDIETSGSKPDSSQIIEIGALMIENGKEIGRFESFVKADVIPDNIIRLTGITLEHVKDAPSLKSVLERFRVFLKDAVFMAHNVNFDYGFISSSMESAGFGPLLNRKICTIDLAKKTIVAPRYGLSFLTEHLEIKGQQHHRAFSDAYAATVVFETSLKNIPEHIITTEDLLNFAKPIPKKRKKKNKASL